jgi:two-component system, response regulator PdtaR
MTPGARVLIADDEAIRLMTLKRQLAAIGMDVVAEATTGREAVNLARETQPDLAILDIKMPDLDGIEAARTITRMRPIPILLLTAYSDRTLIERAGAAGVYGYLVKPVAEEDLLPAILTARARFREFQGLRAEVATLGDALEARKVIERAKGMLMDRFRLSEAEAFRRMQIQSQRENRRLVDIARALLESPPTP